MTPAIITILRMQSSIGATVMPLFAVHLLFSIEVQAVDVQDSPRELAIHVLSAADGEDATRRGEAVGKDRQHAWRNQGDEEVRRVFMAVAEVQSLDAPALGDGMEVSSWLWQGERLVVEEGWQPDARTCLLSVR